MAYHFSLLISSLFDSSKVFSIQNELFLCNCFNINFGLRYGNATNGRSRKFCKIKTWRSPVIWSFASCRTFGRIGSSYAGGTCCSTVPCPDYSSCTDFPSLTDHTSCSDCASFASVTPPFSSRLDNLRKIGKPTKSIMTSNTSTQVIPYD